MGLRLGHAAARRSLLLGAILLATGPAAEAAPQAPEETLARASELLDAQQPQAAEELLNRWLLDHPRDARALLLRSTARFVLGEMEAGRRDLDGALEADPTLRQAWLNRAALDLADDRLDAALEAFLAAERLDPAAPDNSLNLGAVLLMQGRLDEASQRFDAYLRASQSSAEASYLVATNYAMAGYAGLSLEHLGRAIRLDERTRLRARTDANFSAMADNPQLQRLLLTDGYEPPPGAHRAERRFDAAYAGGQGPLLPAVLDALQISGQPYDPRIEVTPEWALVWSDVRIKVRSLPDGGQVQLTAPAQRFTPEEWRNRSEALFRRIALQLYSRRLPGAAGDGR